MGRMPPKSAQVKPPRDSSEMSEASPPGPSVSTRRVTRSSPSKPNKPAPPATRRRGPAPKRAPPQPAEKSPTKGGKSSPRKTVDKEIPKVPEKEVEDSSSESETEPGGVGDEPSDKEQPGSELPLRGQSPTKQTSTNSSSPVRINEIKTSPGKATETSKVKDVNQDSSSSDESEPEKGKNEKQKKAVQQKNVIKASKVVKKAREETDTKPTNEGSINKILDTEEAFNEGRNIIAVMKPEEVHELLGRIDKQCFPLDTLKVQTRENSIDWNKVAFSSYGPKQCHLAWMFLRSKARRYRILGEVVSEVKLKYASNKTFNTKLIESMPGFPQRPATALGGFHYFNRQEWEKCKLHKSPEQDLPNFIKFQRDCKEKYNAMSKAEKEKFEHLSAMDLAEYEKLVKQFYIENPGLAQLTARLKEEERTRHNRRSLEAKRVRTAGSSKTASATPRLSTKSSQGLPDPYPDAPQPPQTPAVLFIQSKLNRLDPPPTGEELAELKTKFFEKWKNLPEEKRLNWINYCIGTCLEYIQSVEEYQQEHPGYSKKEVKMKQIISKDELALWENAHGRPPNPTQSVFDLFHEEISVSPEYADLSEEEKKKLAFEKWKDMDWYHKEIYKMKYKMSMVEFKKGIQEFFSTLPEILKPMSLARVPKKFVKMLEEVDKVPEPMQVSTHASEFPEVGENETMQEESQEYDQEHHSTEPEESPPKKKKKKDKKKRRRETEMSVYEEEEVEEPQIFNVKYEDDQYQMPQALDVEPKKKKKKKKRREEDYDAEPETITGDLYSDSHSEGPNHVSDSLGPIIRQKLTEEQLTFLKRQTDSSKAQKRPQADAEFFRSGGEKPAVILKDSFVKQFKPSSKLFPPDNTLRQKDIFEAVRGIFDGRAHLGRRFSVYYYYAKFVASEKLWIDSIEKDGLEKTSLKIIETFLSLNNHQKDIFIDQSFRYYFDKVHGTKVLVKEDLPLALNNISDGLFPGEPVPPPKKASTLYLNEMKKQSATGEFRKWEDADEHIQTYYIKKLYHQTKLYMKRYDLFMNSMTPNDMVEYTVYRARVWENQLYEKQSLSWAAKEFTFPLAVQEIFDMGQEFEPEMETERTINNMRSRKGRRERNPFSNSNALDKIIRKMPKIPSSKIKQERPQSDDDPSEDEQGGFSLCDNKPFSANFLRKRKIRKASKYLYSVNDLFPNLNKTMSVSTQVEVPKVNSKGTQTPDPKWIPYGKSSARKGKQSTQNCLTKSEIPNNSGAIMQEIACSLVVPYLRQGATISALKEREKAKRLSQPVSAGVAKGVKSNVSTKKLISKPGRATQMGVSNATEVEGQLPDFQTTLTSQNQTQVDHQQPSEIQPDVLDQMEAEIAVPHADCSPVDDQETGIDINRSPNSDLPSPLKPVAEFSFPKEQDPAEPMAVADDFHLGDISTDIILL